MFGQPLIFGRQAQDSESLYWEDHDCCIVGKATNGHAAIGLILEMRPDIVITDIRMPVMNGLEVIEACQDKGCEFAFIFLTNLEDFQLAKQAVHLGAADYLVKLDLQSQTLVQALDRAKEHCSRMESHHNRELYSILLKDNQKQLERSYFSQLIFQASEGLRGTEILRRAESSHPPEGLAPPEHRPAANPEIDALYETVRVVLFQMRPEQILFGQPEAYDFQFIASQLLDVVSGIGARYFSSHTILTPRKDTMLLVACPKPESGNEKSFSEFCTKVNVALGTYFALTALFGISRQKPGPAYLAQAYGEARTALEHCYYDSTLRIAFYREQDAELDQPSQREFNINFLKKSMSAAVLENESQELKSMFQELSDLFRQYKPDKTQAASACINIYTYLHDLLQKDGSQDGDFPYSIDIAQQLSRLASLDDIDPLIFDEIDAGISGKTAWKVSEQLDSVAHAYQVICITHLPQIAAMADRHYVIEKTANKSSTVTDIRLLEEDENLQELGRLLGSDGMTDAVLSNAREMRQQALKHKTLQSYNPMAESPFN